jgi:DNA-binding response OmpR family regulator
MDPYVSIRKGPTLGARPQLPKQIAAPKGDALAAGASMEIVQNFRGQRETLADVVVLCAEEEVRDVIAYWFSELPVRTFVVADGYEANRILRDAARALLITDRVLPPWPGLDTFRQMQSRNPHLRIACIDDGTPDTRILARLTGANVVLPRPLKRRAVLEAFGRLELTT